MGTVRGGLDEMADKMDFCMDLVLGHIQERAGRGEVGEVYAALLHAFHATVLETHRAKFTQVRATGCRVLGFKGLGFGVLGFRV